MEDPFLSIRPYNEREVKFAICSLLDDPYFLSAIKYFSDQNSYNEIINDFHQVDSVYAFQYYIIKRFVNFVIEHSTDGITCSGIENLSPNESYVFIGNHRDIVLDSAFLQQYLLNSNFHTTKIAFGDNLISSSTLEVFFKINKMFIVKRGGSIKEKLLNSHLLSKYIYYSLHEEKESVWIAQGNGRTKNGIDKTQQGLVKMLADYSKHDILTGIKALKIVPVSISYQYESCDQLKARELALSENGEYVKSPGEDFASMKKGIFGYKGKVNLSVGSPIVEEIDLINPDLRPNDQIGEVCRLIDNQIHSHYKLYPNNFIAYDLLEKREEFANQYTTEEKIHFLEYIKKQSIVEDVSPSTMQDYLLRIYANPVRISFGKDISITDDNNW